METALPYLHLDERTRVVRLDPHDPRFFGKPYEAYALLHERAPVFFWEDYGLWCFGRFDDVNRLLRDKRLGRQRIADWPGDRRHLTAFDAVEANSLLELEPPLHTKLRTLVNRAFVSRQVERLRPRAQGLANNLIDGFESNLPVDLLGAYAAPLPITIIAEMLGVPVAMGPQLLSWSNQMVAMYMHGRTRETEIAADQAVGDFAAFLRTHMNERRNSRSDDLLSLLISAQDGDQKLTEDELISSVILLLNAGHEATVHQTGNAVWTILKRGADPLTLFGTDEQTAATVEECLRFDAPLHMFTRHVYEEIELPGGVHVRRGDQIGLLLGMANRDPAAFDRPNHFLPGRADQKNVSFGAGIHFCIGAPLARLELQASLSTLFTRLPAISIAEVPTYRDTFHFHGLERLVVSPKA